MTDSPDITVAPVGTLSRRKLLSAAPALAGARALPTAALAIEPTSDPLAALLARQKALEDYINKPANGVGADDPIWDELHAADKALIGVPALSLATAHAALLLVIEDMRNECYGDQAACVYERRSFSLLKAATDRLGSELGKAGRS